MTHPLYTGLVTAVRKKVEVEENDKAMLICKSLKSIALCTFIAPDGKTYGAESIGQVLERKILYFL